MNMYTITIKQKFISEKIPVQSIELYIHANDLPDAIERAKEYVNIELFKGSIVSAQKVSGR